MRIKISETEGTDGRETLLFQPHSLASILERASWGSAHQGQSPKCEQVVGNNINAAHGNHGKIIALIFAL